MAENAVEEENRRGADCIVVPIEIIEKGKEENNLPRQVIFIL